MQTGLSCGPYSSGQFCPALSSSKYFADDDMPASVECFDKDAGEDESDNMDGTDPDIDLDGDSDADSKSTSDDDDNDCELDDSDGSDNESGFEF